MTVSLGLNIASLKTQTALGRAAAELDRVMSRLSSGQRIVHASDDAASLSVADHLRADSRVLEQGVRNLNDAVNLTRIEESALEELSSIVIRIRELATQSANGVLGNTQRSSLDAEAQQLSKEYLRISQNVQFNNLSLFDGSVPQLQFQSGYGSNGTITLTGGGAIGTASYAAAVNYTFHTTNTYALASGDLNGDGLVDLVAAGENGGGAVAVALGNGSGGLGPINSYAAETGSSQAVTLEDLNNDGFLDIATAGNDGGSGRATIRLGNGNGTFKSAVSYLTEPTNSRSIACRDINQDGILDLLTSGIDGSNNGFFTVRIGNGNGTFRTATTYTTGSMNHEIALADLNRDGRLDVVTSGGTLPGSTSVRLNTGSGTFGPAVSYVGSNSNDYALALGDINGDGITDLVTGGQSVSADGSIVSRLGLGNGTFAAATSYLCTPFNNYFSITLADINGDGFLDYAGTGFDNSALGINAVGLGNGDGTFKAAATSLTGIAFGFAFAMADLNRDGVLDAISAGIGGGGAITIGESASGVAPLLPVSLATMANSRQSMGTLDAKLSQLSSHRGLIGAFQQRIETAISVSLVQKLNYQAAESQLRDADTAEESARWARLKIQQNAAVSVLTQANQEPALALILLDNVS